MEDGKMKTLLGMIKSNGRALYHCLVLQPGRLGTRLLCSPPRKGGKALEARECPCEGQIESNDRDGRSDVRWDSNTET